MNEHEKPILVLRVDDAPDSVELGARDTEIPPPPSTARRAALFDATTLAAELTAGAGLLLDEAPPSTRRRLTALGLVEPHEQG
ncbi:MAG: hypothetical protein R3B72_42055 [Polyangiaceae bacterium]